MKSGKFGAFRLSHHVRPQSKLNHLTHNLAAIFTSTHRWTLSTTHRSQGLLDRTGEDRSHNGDTRGRDTLSWRNKTRQPLKNAHHDRLDWSQFLFLRSLTSWLWLRTQHRVIDTGTRFRNQPLGLLFDRDHRRLRFILLPAHIDPISQVTPGGSETRSQREYRTHSCNHPNTLSNGIAGTHCRHSPSQHPLSR